MSDTKNHKLAIKAIIEAHRTPGKMREIMLTILSDKPSAIVNAWDEVKPDDASDGDLWICSNCLSLTTTGALYCGDCGTKQDYHPEPSIIKQSESP